MHHSTHFISISNKLKYCFNDYVFTLAVACARLPDTARPSTKPERAQSTQWPRNRSGGLHATFTPKNVLNENFKSSSDILSTSPLPRDCPRQPKTTRPLSNDKGLHCQTLKFVKSHFIFLISDYTSPVHLEHECR
jgi:hypothetical protein